MQKHKNRSFFPVKERIFYFKISPNPSLQLLCLGLLENIQFAWRMLPRICARTRIVPQTGSKTLPKIRIKRAFWCFLWNNEVIFDLIKIIKLYHFASFFGYVKHGVENINRCILLIVGFSCCCGCFQIFLVQGNFLVDHLHQIVQGYKRSTSSSTRRTMH